MLAMLMMRRSTPLHQGLGEGLARIEGALQIDVDDPIPVIFLHAQQQRIPGHSRVVDENVDRAQILRDALGELADLRRIRDVTAEPSGLDTLALGRSHGIRHSIRRGRYRGDLAALPRQGHRDRPTDAATGAGDHGDFSVQIEPHDGSVSA